MELNSFFIYLDLIIFILFSFSVGYVLIYALASLKSRNIKYPNSEKLYKILVLFPAYKEDIVIINSIESFLKQDYPSTYFDIVVISDNMKKETNETLNSLSIKVLEINFENSSKAKALKYAINNIEDNVYDIVVIMDADNTTDNDYLKQICNAFDSGIMAIQTHRVAKNLNTDIAILDAVSEEINNSIFRRGHVNLGVSSALIGSGMAFCFKWFKENIHKVVSFVEERELEILLLRQKLFIEYLEEVKVYDEKTQTMPIFYKQRKRWLASQFIVLKMVIKELPEALFSLNISYADKIVQWMLLPRVILLGLIGFISFAISIINITSSVKWWILLFVLIFSLALSIPHYLINKKLFFAIKKVPLIFAMMVFGIFKIKSASKGFIHTEKNFQNNKIDD